jgi:hypothetical protein
MIEWCIQVSQLRAAYKRDGYPDSEALDLAVHEFSRRSDPPRAAKSSRRKSSLRCERMVRPLSLEQWERRHGKGARR